MGGKASQLTPTTGKMKALSFYLILTITAGVLATNAANNAAANLQELHQDRTELINTIRR